MKNLLDLTPIEALQGKPIVIVAMGASPHHFLAIDFQLRPVLTWFGALVAPTAVYLTGNDFRDGRLAWDDAQADWAALVSTLATLARLDRRRSDPCRSPPNLPERIYLGRRTACLMSWPTRARLIS
ncbi:MAG: NAD(P)H-dependent oxidoreductase [Hyphomicrobiales bacterium]|nr:NAD(P)H-dependent oxidoreductase [Hyphomicrobiales bacterium]